MDRRRVFIVLAVVTAALLTSHRPCRAEDATDSVAVAFPPPAAALTAGEAPPPDPLRFGGPVELMDIYLPSQLRPQSYPESATTLPRGSGSVRAVVEWANDITRDEHDRYLFDGESVNTVIRLRYAPLERFETGFDVPWTNRSGGSLDSFIEWVETSVNSEVEDRYDLPSSSWTALAVNGQGQSTLRMRQGNGLGDISLHAKYALFREQEHGFDASISASLGLPTGSDTFGGEGVTPMLGIHVQKPWRTASLFGGGTIQYHSDATEQSFSLAPYRWMTYAGGEWRPWLRWFSLVLQFQIDGPIARGYGALNQPSYYYMFGFRFHLPKNITLETAAVENLGKIQNRNSSDVVFSFALTWRFDGLGRQ